MIDSGQNRIPDKIFASEFWKLPLTCRVQIYTFKKPDSTYTQNPDSRVRENPGNKKTLVSNHFG